MVRATSQDKGFGAGVGCVLKLIPLARANGMGSVRIFGASHELGFQTQDNAILAWIGLLQSWISLCRFIYVYSVRGIKEGHMIKLLLTST